MCNSHPVQPMYLVLANINVMNAKFKFNQAQVYYAKAKQHTNGRSSLV